MDIEPEHAVRYEVAVIRAAVVWAIVAAGATAAVGAVALLGVERLPVLEYILFPGSMAAWMFRGDDYASSREFLVFAVLFGVPINAALGAALGAVKTRLFSAR
jgi:hypothetical protein